MTRWEWFSKACFKGIWREKAVPSIHPSQLAGISRPCWFPAPESLPSDCPSTQPLPLLSSSCSYPKCRINKCGDQAEGGYGAWSRYPSMLWCWALMVPMAESGPPCHLLSCPQHAPGKNKRSPVASLAGGTCLESLVSMSQLNHMPAEPASLVSQHSRSAAHLFSVHLDRASLALCLEGLEKALRSLSPECKIHPRSTNGSRPVSPWH